MKFVKHIAGTIGGYLNPFAGMKLWETQRQFWLNFLEGASGVLLIALIPAGLTSWVTASALPPALLLRHFSLAGAVMISFVAAMSCMLYTGMVGFRLWRDLSAYLKRRFSIT